MRPRRRIRAIVSCLRSVWIGVGVAVLSLLAAELLTRAADSVLGSSARPSNMTDWAVIRRRSSVYDGADWADQLFDEFDRSLEMEWHSYVYWRRRPFAGRFVNVDERGLRVTPDHSEGVNRSEIFLFGGSVVWGTGARDAHTVAAEVALRFADDPHRYRVINFGESGYVSMQELLALELELARGHVPAVAVFVDGFNDVHSAHQNGVAGLPLNEEHRRHEFEWRRPVGSGIALLEALRRHSALFRRLTPEPAAAGSVPRVDARQLAEETLGLYRSRMRIIRALAHEYGFHAYFFWQPTPLAKDPKSPEEERLVEWFPGRELQQQVDDLVRAAAARDDIHLLLDAFDGRPESIFLDYCHISESGNRLIAEEICRVVTAGE